MDCGQNSRDVIVREAGLARKAECLQVCSSRVEYRVVPLDRILYLNLEKRRKETEEEWQLGWQRGDLDDAYVV